MKSIIFKKAVCVVVSSYLALFGLLSSASAADEIKDVIPSIQKEFFSVFQESKKIDEKSIKLNDFYIKKDKEYYVTLTFVSSISGNNNGFGYFTFDNKVVVSPATKDINIKKSNIKETILVNNAKTIEKGKQIKIGPIKSGQNIGFFIVTPTGNYYSIECLNSDSVSHTGKYKQKIKDSYFVLLGFEDFTIAKSDKDYNDVVFLVDTDNYDFPNVPTKDNSPLPKSKVTPTKIVAPTPTKVFNATPTVAVTPVVSANPTPKSGDLPKTGEGSTDTYIIGGLGIAILGLLFIIFSKRRR